MGNYNKIIHSTQFFTIKCWPDSLPTIAFFTQDIFCILCFQGENWLSQF